MITVSILLASICFTSAGEERCHHALVGKNTPVGTFSLMQRRVVSDGYGGDVLQFKETDEEVFAIHRVWTKAEEQQREKRLASKNASDRVITNGCINVSSEVYQALVRCCLNQPLIIK